MNTYDPNSTKEKVLRYAPIGISVAALIIALIGRPIPRFSGPSDSPFDIESLDNDKSYRPPKRYMELNGFYYFPVRDKNLSPENASKLIELINEDLTAAKTFHAAQVSQSDLAKYDTLVASEVEIKLTSDYNNIRIWINGFDVRMGGNYVKLKDVPIRPENIHLVLMVHYPDEAKLSGTIRINGKDVDFEFKDLKAVDIAKKDFNLSEFGIEKCKYIPPCTSNPV